MRPTGRRILVLLPNWVGDAVMFTPALGAIRAHYADAFIALFGRAAPAAVLTPNPWSDLILPACGSVLAEVTDIRAGKFDLAVLAPNSFRSALVAFMAGIPSRVGYNRNGRGWLLTEKLEPPRGPDGHLLVTPALGYYLQLAARLGCPVANRTMELSAAPADAAKAELLLTKANVQSSRPTVLLNPGAAFGSTKLYPADRFAAVADALASQDGAQIIINAGPAEGKIADAVASAMKCPPALNLAKLKNSLGLLKAMVARSSLMITNDTGPRHIAAALHVPVVTIFGSTDPGWTTIDYSAERIIRVQVECGPCQRKLCRLPPGRGHHQCMQLITPQMVIQAARELLAVFPALPRQT